MGLLTLLRKLKKTEKEFRILVLGLDNAGKTTLLGMLKDNRMTTMTPTIHPNSEQLIMGSIKFSTFDLGGHESGGRVHVVKGYNLIKRFYHDCKALVGK